MCVRERGREWGCERKREGGCEKEGVGESEGVRMRDRKIERASKGHREKGVGDDQEIRSTPRIRENSRRGSNEDVETESLCIVHYTAWHCTVVK